MVIHLVTPARVLVCVHPEVVAALSACAQWPDGCAGGGVLLGTSDSGCLLIDGAALLWYRLPQGLTYQCWAPDQWRKAVLGERQVIGTFIAGSPLHLTWEMLTAIGVSGLEAQVAAAALNGEVSFTAGGSIIEPEDWPGVPGPVELFGMDPWRLPGSGRQRRRRRRWLMPAVALATVAAAAVAGGAWLHASSPGLSGTAGATVAPVGAPAVAGGAEAAAVGVSNPAGSQSGPAQTGTTPSGTSPIAGSPSGGGQGSKPPAGNGPTSVSPSGGSQSSTAAKPGPEPPLPATYTVQRGDTLYAVAIHFYGDTAYIEKIRTANNLKGSTIVAGQRLTLPPRAG